MPGTRTSPDELDIETGFLLFASISTLGEQWFSYAEIRQTMRQMRTRGGFERDEDCYLDVKGRQLGIPGICSWDSDPIYIGPSSGSSGGSSGSPPNLPPIGHEQERLRQGSLSPEVFEALAYPGPRQEAAMRAVNEEWQRARPSVRHPPSNVPRSLPVLPAAFAHPPTPFAPPPTPVPSAPSHFPFGTARQSQQVCTAQPDRLFETDDAPCEDCWQSCLFPSAPPRAWSPGDWLCPQCRQHNFSNRERCFNPRCAAPRPAWLYAYARAGPPAYRRDRDRRVRRFQNDLLGRDRLPTRPPPQPPSISTPNYAESSRMGQLRAAGSRHASRSGPG
ncbi:hypothetical protein BCR39DRAFT_160770 [Naematelia encephala]|uniref:RanBP2-type domain-containing protein n=1 Tax=Naematelia encephala TaxID=71784 RepID=A0A1Y2B4I9_9TREE|nr:hypothetical protein BCR39DRAFT_160770 [Naematelia encephala]